MKITAVDAKYKIAKWKILLEENNVTFFDFSTFIGKFYHISQAVVGVDISMISGSIQYGLPATSGVADSEQLFDLGSTI